MLAHLGRGKLALSVRVKSVSRDQAGGGLGDFAYPFGGVCKWHAGYPAFVLALGSSKVATGFFVAHILSIICSNSACMQLFLSLILSLYFVQMQPLQRRVRVLESQSVLKGAYHTTHPYFLFSASTPFWGLPRPFPKHTKLCLALVPLYTLFLSWQLLLLDCLVNACSPLDPSHPPQCHALLEDFRNGIDTSPINIPSELLGLTLFSFLFPDCEFHKTGQSSLGQCLTLRRSTIYEHMV